MFKRIKDDCYKKLTKKDKCDINLIDRIHYTYIANKLDKIYKKFKNKYKNYNDSVINLCAALYCLTDGLTCISDLEHCNKKLKHYFIWVKFNSIKKLNKFLWGCCYRWTTINRGGLWDLKIENGDTSLYSKSINCYLQTSKEATAEDLHELSCSLVRFLLDFTPTKRFNIFKNHYKLKFIHIWWNIKELFHKFEGMKYND